MIESEQSPYAVAALFPESARRHAASFTYDRRCGGFRVDADNFCPVGRMIEYLARHDEEGSVAREIAAAHSSMTIWPTPSWQGAARVLHAIGAIDGPGTDEFASACRMMRELMSANDSGLMIDVPAALGIKEG